MKIRLNVTRGDRLAEVEYDIDDQGVLLARESLARFAADAFEVLEAAVDSGTLQAPPPCARPPAREPGDDEPNRSGPVRPGVVSGREAVPKNGRQLWAWASNHGCLDRLKALAKESGKGRIVDWPEDLVQWAHRELTAKAGAGKWGSN